MSYSTKTSFCRIYLFICGLILFWFNFVTILFDRIYNRSKFISLIPWVSGWPTKMSLFLFGNSCYKSKESFKIFSPQILEVYRILLVKTTLESIIFYYTFSVINTMFVPCTALLYDSTAATRTLKLSTTLLSISYWICLISFLILEYLRHNFPWDRLISRQTDNPWSSYSQDLNPTIFWGGTWKTVSVKTIHR